MKHILIYIAMLPNGDHISTQVGIYDEIFDCYNDREVLIEYHRGRPIVNYQYVCVRKD